MNALNPVMWSVHVGFAVLWTGGVLFVALAVLPPALRGEIDGGALGSIVDRLRWITRIAAVAFLASGGHMAGTLYTFDSLTGSARGAPRVDDDRLVVPDHRSRGGRKREADRRA